MEDNIPVLFVTANVGSIFEQPDVMLELWAQEFLKTVIKSKAKFIALHCQEVGGKNYEQSMQYVKNFVKFLTLSEELSTFDKAKVFLDEDFSCAESFTALGNFYFIHETVSDALIWNFEDLEFVPVIGKDVHSGNIEDVHTKEKTKFPQSFFPECKWSRKGYLRTRWSLNGTVFDLVNIHLFHDASNFISMQNYPSEYTIIRRNALQYTLDRLNSYENGVAPIFLFGDFNFRTDTNAVVKKLSNGLNTAERGENDEECLQYVDHLSEVVLTVGKKEFSHSDHQNIFFNDKAAWLKEFDRELDVFSKQLFEFPITFPPSYPFEESGTNGNLYMKTRCPGWCDRVLLSSNAKEIITQEEEEEGGKGVVKYGIIGRKSSMGDHKPVYLQVNIKNNKGIVCTQLADVNACCTCKFSSAASQSPPLVENQICSNFGPKNKLTLVDININDKVDDDDEDDDELLNSAEEKRRAFSNIDHKTQRFSSFGCIYSDENMKKELCEYCEKNWRKRSHSASSRSSIWRAENRIRLKSNPNLKISLPRMQSHHSSSEEEWFEEVLSDVKNNNDEDGINLCVTESLDDNKDNTTATSHLMDLNGIESDAAAKNSSCSSCFNLCFKNNNNNNNNNNNDKGSRNQKTKGRCCIL